MLRHFVIMCTLSFPMAAEASDASWTCEPVWSFSEMGDKTYSGSGDSEATAQQAARKSCVSHNRGIELDEFCLADPKTTAWHCTQQHNGADGSPTKG